MAEKEKKESTIAPEPHVQIFGREVGGERRPREERAVVTHKHYHQYRGYAGGNIFGIPILLAGIVLLLNNYGLVSWDIWNFLALLWPVIVIMIGLRVIAGRNMVSGIVLSIFFGLLCLYIVLAGLVRVGSPVAAWLNLPPSAFSYLNQLK